MSNRVSQIKIKRTRQGSPSPHHISTNRGCWEGKGESFGGTIWGYRGRFSNGKSRPSVLGSRSVEMTSSSRWLGISSHHITCLHAWRNYASAALETTQVPTQHAGCIKKFGRYRVYVVQSSRARHARKRCSLYHTA